MDVELLEIVLERLDVTPLPDEAAGLLLAALDSDKALSAQLSRDTDRPQLPALPGQPVVSLAGAYLRSLTVSGFRGIGPPSTLEVTPGPGLTLVLGRNGSGKSSFAEALEVLLTGTVMRWDLHKAVVWRDSWRCQHVPGSTEIRAEFLVEGSGPAVAARDWPAGASFDQSAAWVQRAGQKRGGLSKAVRDLAAKAAAEHSRRDDRWAPVAANLASWCAGASAASEGIKPVAAIRKARAWLVSATGDIRNARLAPLASQARAVWAMLRQESNVDLGAFRLAGTSTHRKLELDVSIDGSPGAALGVMSQGEINALALSVFLPRATMPGSPFRFLVIDDPVQAMDPAKVDGLARVLKQTAADRQVIVFTHDNRLADAVKELSIPATILEVTRRPKSVVDVRRCLGPAEQALKDARDLISDPQVSDGVAARVIPGLCRAAVEASLIQAVWRQQARAGNGRGDIEADLVAAKRRLASLAALAIFGDASQHAKVPARLAAWGQRFAVTFRALNAGSHQEHRGPLDQLISDTSILIAKIRAGLP